MSYNLKLKKKFNFQYIKKIVDLLLIEEEEEIYFATSSLEYRD